ncbi:DUF4435 domain-containing protein [Streptococcus pacificus]|uniref:AAA family ATPase n=1 Tax=Streptococcus pacificus TaxID=2740577 RepID=A0ABS0ZKA2_9STRE|nr:AAA family ATPase [Streptococcus pacificus]MBJ8326382.1 AAA family ATPase [Streptococcus pacificus]
MSESITKEKEINQEHVLEKLYYYKKQIEISKENEYSESDAEIFDASLEIIVQLINEIKKSKESTLIFNSATNSFKKLLQSWYKQIVNIDLNRLPMAFRRLKQINHDYHIMKIFSFMANIENTTVLIGANGSGKSTLIDTLRGVNNNQVFVLPAQKYLYFSTETFGRQSISVKTYQDMMKESTIKINRTDFDDYFIRNKFTNPFTYLITFLVKEYTNIATNRRRGDVDLPEPIFDRLERVWDHLLPEIKFKIDPDDRLLEVKKNDTIYNLNGLSDGEKCILFYIGNVLIAPKNSYIVVDEPETFLNSAIYNELWNLLITERSDCQFIFASHNLDFVQARNNVTYVWCHEYTKMGKFNYDILNEEDIPISLLTEISGSRKPILFCEGTKDSIDYQIYSKLLENYFYIKPVKGHKNVIEYTKAYNKLSNVTHNKAFGIIDNDWMEESYIIHLMNDNIFSLEFNEIEMLLLDEDVIFSVLSYFNEENEIATKFNNFSDKLINTCRQETKKMSKIALKKQVDDYIQNTFIQNKEPSKSDILEFFDSLKTNFNTDSKYQKIIDKIEKALETSNYHSILKICNLKGQVLNGLGDKLLENNYQLKALKRIELDNSLREKMREKYFATLIGKVNNIERN